MFVKHLLQECISPFLGVGTPQQRFVILHEIARAHEKDFQQFITWIFSLPQHQDITVTFDDGFRSSYEAIKNIPPHKAIFFVCPEYVDYADKPQAWQKFFYNNLLCSGSFSDNSLVEAMRPVSWDELKELVQLGYRIGSHTMTHARLSNVISQKELEREIIGSADVIEDKLQIKVDAFAHPFGDVKSVNDRSLKIIKKRYAQFFTGLRGNNIDSQNPNMLWRDTVHFYWPKEYIEFLLAGGFDCFYWYKRKQLQHMDCER